VEELVVGDLIQTLKHGWVPISHLLRQRVLHSPTSPLLYQMMSVPGCVLTQDHSLLVSSLTEEQRNQLKNKVTGKLYVTDGMFRLPAYLAPSASVYPESGVFDIHHIVLENDNELTNYGIFCEKGLLVESCSRFAYKRGNTQLQEGLDEGGLDEGNQRTRA
jgi:hypothetical protein